MATRKPPQPKMNGVRKMLNADHFDMIEAVLQRLGELPDHLEAAELCDVDCKAFREAHAYYIDKFTKIRQKYFPQGRPK